MVLLTLIDVCAVYRVLDTALLYPHPSGPPAKCALRVLCQKYLNRTIQQGAHDSIIDAQAALDLVRLKLQNGEPKRHPRTHRPQYDLVGIWIRFNFQELRESTYVLARW